VLVTLGAVEATLRSARSCLDDVLRCSGGALGVDDQPAVVRDGEFARQTLPCGGRSRLAMIATTAPSAGIGDAAAGQRVAIAVGPRRGARLHLARSPRL